MLSSLGLIDFSLYTAAVRYNILTKNVGKSTKDCTKLYKTSILRVKYPRSFVLFWEREVLLLL